MFYELTEKTGPQSNRSQMDRLFRAKDVQDYPMLWSVPTRRLPCY